MARLYSQLADFLLEASLLKIVVDSRQSIDDEIIRDLLVGTGKKLPRRRAKNYLVGKECFQARLAREPFVSRDFCSVLAAQKKCHLIL
jgi:hypothetical protein